MQNTQQHLASFNGYPIEIIDHNNQHWLTGEQVGLAIGLKHARTGIHKLFTRHADEFTEEMSCVVDVATEGQSRQIRIFSPRGAHMLAMWAQTGKAKAFRAWVLDVLEEKQQMAGLDIPTHIRRELLRANPTWQQIVRYKTMGLNNIETSKLLGVHKDNVRRSLRRMEQCGIIEPPANLQQMQQQARHLLLAHEVA